MTNRGVTAVERARYAALRRLIHDVTEVEINRSCPPGCIAIELTGITEEALSCWEEIRLMQYRPGNPGGWDWSHIHRVYRRFKKRFEVAVWAVVRRSTSPYDEVRVLCGFAVGKPSRANHVLSIYFMERSPDPDNPLKTRILSIVLDTAMAHAMAIGSKQLRLVRPLPGIRPKYEALGFRFVEGRKRYAPYCVREVWS